MQEIIDLDEGDIALYLCCADELLFMLLFWADDFSQEMTVEQKLMACDRSKRVLACTGRKIAKTLIIESKVVRLSMMHTQRGGGITEAMMFTPRDSHLTPIVDRIYGRIYRTPFLKEFFTEMRRGEAPKLSCKTGLVWYSRIEGVSGTDQNMVGLRARYILGDELAFGNIVCHQSRIQTALPNCEWWYSGVPNGVRSSPFYLLDQTRMGQEWSRHKYPTFVNPIYQGDEAKESLIESYNGAHTQGYKTQVLGEWGDETVSSFPPGAISVGNQPYYVKTLTSAVKNSDSAVAIALGLPSVRADKFCIGWDYGYSPDPSVLLIAHNRGGNKWECYARIVMRQVVLPVQCRVVHYLYSTLLLGGLGGICCDNASAIQTLRANDPAKADRFFQTAAGGTMGMIDELGQPVMEKNEKTGNDEQVMIRVKQYLTERFRQYMINTNLELPGIQLTLGNDTELIEELAGTTESKTQGGYTVYYGPPDPESSGKMLDHGADSGRHLADAIMKAIDRPEESDEEFLASMGWAKGKGEAWTPAWEDATPSGEAGRNR